MKVRARKLSVSMSESDHAPCSNKKRRKESSFWQRKKEVASALITSTTRKRRIETTTSLCLVSPTRVRLLPSLTQTSVEEEDLCRNLHFTFSSMDTALADTKESNAGFNVEADILSVSDKDNDEREGNERGSFSLDESKSYLESAVAASRPSILETIFSPVFHLFRGSAEDFSSSCQSSVEQSEPPELRAESLDVMTSVEATSIEASTLIDADALIRPVPHAEESTSIDDSRRKWDHDAIIASCSTPIVGCPDDIAECRFESCLALSDSEDHPLNMKSAIENAVVSLVDASGECIEWDPLDDKASCGEERPGLDHVQGDADVLASNDADLFLAVEQARSLECNDEGSNEGEVVVEEEEDFEDIDIDPYLFIKRLPSLEEVVSPCRPLLLPRQTRRSPPITLVLDLDETLVHSTLEFWDDADFSFPVHFDFQDHMVYVRRRPHLQMFMERVAQLFEIIVFTASQSIYAEQLLNVLDPKRKLIRHRIFRDSCVFVRGNYLKDLTILGRDLSKVAIIDNSPQAYGFQVDNGIPIESWYHDRSDSALAGLLPFLETLVGVDDVRPIIAKRFNLRGKIAAAGE